MARPPRLHDITAKTPPYASECMPKLSLATNLDFDYRVYVMECTPPPGCSGPYYYVGIEHATRVGHRCVQHDEHKGSHFTRANAPTKLHLLWPAANTAVEGYVYLALLSTMRQDSVAKLGGWTQTSIEPTSWNCEIPIALPHNDFWIVMAWCKTYCKTQIYAT